MTGAALVVFAFVLLCLLGMASTVRRIIQES